MSLRKQQQETGNGGALVPVHSSAVMRQANSPELAARDHAANPAQTRVIVAARSVFLTQLASQYESKSAACARRMEARATATHCYDEKLPKPALRHLVWA